MIEKDYYENEAFWNEETTYLNKEIELSRFSAIQALIPETTKSILDVGCGNGAFLKYLEDTGTQYTLKGYERSKVAIANRLCESEIENGNAEDIKYEDNSFDVVVALEVIEHLPYGVYEKTLEELQRVAKNHIIISVPYKEKERLVKCQYCGSSYSPYFHMRSFNGSKMKNLFSEFSPVVINYIARQKAYFIWNYFKNLWHIKINKGITEKSKHTPCPICGYHHKNEINSIVHQTNNSKSNRIKSIIRSITPYTINYRWIAGLYQKS